MKNSEKKPTNKKLLLSATIIAISIVVIGISFTYAYFSLRYSGGSKVTKNTAAILDVTSTLTSATAINASQMNLISADEVATKAKKVNFSVTNESTSNVNAKYIVKLVDFSVSKNLSSQYFKWKLIVNGGTANEQVLTGNFLDTTIATEGTSDPTKVTGLNKELIPEASALPLAISATDNLEFYIWLENNPAADQLYLTNGSFNAKLSVEAFPTK